MALTAERRGRRASSGAGDDPRSGEDGQSDEGGRLVVAESSSSSLDEDTECPRLRLRASRE
jgi:hypothetical protein